MTCALLVLVAVTHPALVFVGAVGLLLAADALTTRRLHRVAELEAAARQAAEAVSGVQAVRDLQLWPDGVDAAGFTATIALDDVSEWTTILADVHREAMAALHRAGAARQ